MKNLAASNQTAVSLVMKEVLLWPMLSDMDRQNSHSPNYILTSFPPFTLTIKEIRSMFSKLFSENGHCKLLHGRHAESAILA